MAYQLLETTTEIEFEHYLAAKLGMTVARLRDEMPNSEFVSWSMYYSRIAQRQELERLKAGGGTGG